MSKKPRPRRQRHVKAASAAPGAIVPRGTLKPLPDQLEAFLLVYDSNGGNGVRAWMETHPDTKSHVAAATSAYQALRKPQIRKRLGELREARFRRLQMSGDEALGRVALDAAPDIRRLYDERGKLLPVHLWPDDLVNSVRSVKPGPFGDTIVLNDSLAARKIILEHTGKLKTPAASILTLAKILAGDFDEKDEEP